MNRSDSRFANIAAAVFLLLVAALIATAAWSQGPIYSAPNGYEVVWKSSGTAVPPLKATITRHIDTSIPLGYTHRPLALVAGQQGYTLDGGVDGVWSITVAGAPPLAFSQIPHGSATTVHLGSAPTANVTADAFLHVGVFGRYCAPDAACIDQLNGPITARGGVGTESFASASRLALDALKPVLGRFPTEQEMTDWVIVNCSGVVSSSCPGGKVEPTPPPTPLPTPGPSPAPTVTPTPTPAPTASPSPTPAPQPTAAPCAVAARVQPPVECTLIAAALSAKPWKLGSVTQKQAAACQSWLATFKARAILDAGAGSARCYVYAGGSTGALAQTVSVP